MDEDILIQITHLRDQATAMAKEAETLSARASWLAMGLFDKGVEIPLHLVADKFKGVEE